MAAAVVVAYLALTSVAAASGLRTVHYGPITLAAPATWPVRPLGVTGACALLNRHAVYLGHQAPGAHCPASAIGRAASIQIEPLDAVSARGVVFAQGIRTLDGQRARVASDVAATETLTVALPRLGVLVTIPYGHDRALADRLLASIRRRGRPVPAAHASGASRRAPSSVARVAPFTGGGFDTCAAPASGTMSAWLQSPYRAVGVYIGGVNRSCQQPNLSAAWVSQTEGEGWSIMPIYVGLQAPCGPSSTGAKIDPSNAGPQGTQAADDAVGQASQYGFGADPIYLDMEAFPTSDAQCVAAVKAFIAAWTNELHAKGWTSGVYGSAASTGAVLAGAAGTGYPEPDDLWYADWDGRNTTTGDPYVPDGDWSSHQRIHQYQRGHDETWGGATVNVDSDAVDGAVAQAVPAYAYAVVGEQAFSDPRLTQRTDLGGAHIGEDAWVMVAVRNTGTRAWQQGGPNPVRLGTWAPQDRPSAFATRDWLNPQRPAGLQQASVAPNQTGTFVVHVRVPPGTTVADERFNLVAEGLTWMPDQGLDFHVQVVPYAWALVGVRPFSDRRLKHRARLAHLRPGQNVYLLIGVMNTGAQTWEPNGPHPVRIGTWAPQDRHSRFAARDWLSRPTRPAGVASPVASGAVGVFIVHLHVPNRFGKLVERFNLVAEGLAWMPDQGLAVEMHVVRHRRHQHHQRRAGARR